MKVGNCGVDGSAPDGIKPPTIMRAFQVKATVTLSYNPNPRRRGSARQKEHAPGAKLYLDEETSDGEVWFFDENNCRGFVSTSGGLDALLRDKQIEEVEYNE